MTLAIAGADRGRIEIDEPDAVFARTSLGCSLNWRSTPRLVVAFVETTCDSIETCTRMDLLALLQQLLRILQSLRTRVAEKRSCDE
jgi:hypothetical protein